MIMEDASMLAKERARETNRKCLLQVALQILRFLLVVGVAMSIMVSGSVRRMQHGTERDTLEHAAIATSFGVAEKLREASCGLCCSSLPITSIACDHREEYLITYTTAGRDLSKVSWIRI